MEPIRNDSDHGLRNALFDPHIDSNLMDDNPIEPRVMEIDFYEPTKESPQGTDVRREWMIPGNQDCSIQTMPTMILSTNEPVIYKDAIFINKDELKYSLGKLALKVKSKYRIKRSTKTHLRHRV